MEHDGPGGPGMAYQPLDALPTLDPPDVDLVVAVRRPHEGAVMAEGDQERGAHIAREVQRLE